MMSTAGSEQLALLSDLLQLWVGVGGIKLKMLCKDATSHNRAAGGFAKMELSLLRLLLLFLQAVKYHQMSFCPHNW